MLVRIELCVDEKTQVQAVLAAHPAHAADGTRLCRGGYPPNYVRHGTTTLPVCRSRRRHRRGSRSVQSAVTKSSFVLRHVEVNIPPDFDVHLIVDNLRHPQTSQGQSRPRHPNATPHGQSGGTLVRHHYPESHPSRSNVKELVNKIERFVEHYNANTQPLQMDRLPAQSILGFIYLRDS